MLRESRTLSAVAAFVVLSTAALGRPLKTETAGVVPYRGAEVDAGVEYYTGNVVSKAFSLDLNVAYGLASDVEIDLSTAWIPYACAEGEVARGMGDSSLFGKWRFHGRDESPLAAALFAALNLPTGDDRDGLGSGEYDFSTGVAFSWTAPADLMLHFHAGYGWLRGRDDTATFGLAAERPLREDLTLLAEIVADRGALGNRCDDCSRAMVGAVYEIREGLALDLALRFGLDNRTPDLAVAAGATWAF